MVGYIKLSDRTEAFPDVHAALRLVKAFMAIEDAEARKNLLSVVEAMARADTGTDKVAGSEVRTLLSTMIERLG